MELQWGILGASKIAKDFMIAMRSLPVGENKVVAVGSSTESRAKSFAAENGVPKWYGSYKELVSDSDVQVVYVTGTNNTHAALCKLALSHDKHVLCEKPFALDVQETKEVLHLAKEKKLFIMEAMWTRFFPLYLYLQDELSRKALGDVKVAMASHGAAVEDIPRIYKKELGGSVLLDIGIYTLNFADVAFGGEKPESLHVSGHLFETGVDHTVAVTMLYSNKRTAQLLCTAGADLPDSATIIGTKGSYDLEPYYHCCTKLTGPNGPKEFPLPAEVQPTNFPGSIGMRYEIDAVRRSIVNGETENQIMPHSTTLRIMEYMDEIRCQLGVKFD